jgi:hypothetical protein
MAQYVPPNGAAVNFNFGAAYDIPEGDEVNFNFGIYSPFPCYWPQE